MGIRYLEAFIKQALVKVYSRGPDGAVGRGRIERQLSHGKELDEKESGGQSQYVDNNREAPEGLEC